MSRIRSSLGGRRSLEVASAAVAVAVTAPLLAPGFVLSYDMVFVPHQPISGALVGVGRTLPRAVPISLLVTVAARVLTAEVVEKMVLVGIFGLAALGAGRLVPAERVAGRIAAGLLYVWNPLTYERILLGHWALLVGYAALPWVVGSAVGYRRGERGAAWRLVLSLAAAGAATPYTGAFGAALALGVLLPPWRKGEEPKRMLWAGAAAVAVNLPWLVPALFLPAPPGSPALALDLFRARADSPLGLLGSLASLGGLWRTDLSPPGRSSIGWVPAFALIVLVAGLGWRRLRTRWPGPAVVGLAVVAVLGIALAAAPSLPVLDEVARRLVRMPGGGMLRDSQKFVILLAVPGAAAFGAGVDEVLAKLPAAAGPTRLAGLLLPLLPIALAPTLAWGAAGRLAPVRYPPSWDRIEQVMRADPVPGALLVLPWHTYLPFRWNHDRPVHQPALLYFTRPVVADGELKVGPHRLPAEDPWARLADPVVTRSSLRRSDLSRLGVRYVVLFHEADWQASRSLVSGLASVAQEDDLTLYRAPPPAPLPEFDAPPAAPIVAGDVVALGAVGLAAGGAWRTRAGYARRDEFGRRRRSA